MVKRLVYILRTDWFATFWGWGPPKIRPMTLKFKLGRDFVIMQHTN